MFNSPSSFVFALREPSGVVCEQDYTASSLGDWRMDTFLFLQPHFPWVFNTHNTSLNWQNDMKEKLHNVNTVPVKEQLLQLVLVLRFLLCKIQDHPNKKKLLLLHSLNPD